MPYSIWEHVLENCSNNRFHCGSSIKLWKVLKRHHTPVNPPTKQTIESVNLSIRIPETNSSLEGNIIYENKHTLRIMSQPTTVQQNFEAPLTWDSTTR